jgi:uncharacterized membrane protein (UPF0127 family)
MADVYEGSVVQGTGRRPGPALLALLVAALAAVLIFLAIHMLTEVVMDGPGAETETVSFDLADGGSLNFTCEVADDSFERMKGLQNREDLPEDRGMVFVYGEPQHVTFIMPNMHFPLDMVFIAGNGTVINVAEADVEDPDTPYNDLVRYQSEGEVKWVVEINQGLCAANGIGPGTHVTINDADRQGTH